MQISCPECPNTSEFVMPLWVRATFKIEEDGSLTILHVRELESLEEKLVDQGKNSFTLTCSSCGADAIVTFDEYASRDQERREKAALEAL